MGAHLFREALTSVSELYPLIALLIFFSFLIAVFFWIFRPGSKSMYDEVSRYPFRNSEDAYEQSRQSRT